MSEQERNDSFREGRRAPTGSASRENPRWFQIHSFSAIWRAFVPIISCLTNSRFWGGGLGVHRSSVLFLGLVCIFVVFYWHFVGFVCNPFTFARVHLFYDICVNFVKIVFLNYDWLNACSVNYEFRLNEWMSFAKQGTRQRQQLLPVCSGASVRVNSR